MNAVVTAWADLMLRWSWQATLLFGLAWILVKCDRANRPAFRYQVWLLTMIAVAILPLCPALATFIPVQRSAMEPLNYIVDLPAAVGIAAEPVAIVQPVSTFRIVFILVWSSGFLLSFARLCSSWWKMHGIRKRAWQTKLAVLPHVSVDLSRDIASPVLSGIWRPRILLPADIAIWTTEDEQRGIILHEAAHRERRDHYAILLQRIFEAVFFFHPLVRYASRQLALERELACDAEVLRAGADSVAYADVILKVAERGVHERHGLQPAFNSSRKILERRIEMILNAQHSWISNSSWHRRIVTIALFAITAVIGVLIPRVEVTAWTAPPRFEPTLQAIAAPIFTHPTQPPRPRQAQTAPPAQTPPVSTRLGAILGTALDVSGAVIPGVRATLTGPQGVISVVSNQIGAFTFGDLQPGRYRLDAFLPGFAPFTLTLDVTAGTILRPNVMLSLAAVNTTVEVSAQRPTQVVTPPATPNPSTVRPLPIRVGGDVAAPVLVTQTRPVYPATSRASGIEGNVLISATIDKTGSVVNPKVVSRVDAELVAAALEAVQQWRYKPAMLNGQPVEIVSVITVSFSLSD